jgi:hypothetical protein
VLYFSGCTYFLDVHFDILPPFLRSRYSFHEFSPFVCIFIDRDFLCTFRCPSFLPSFALFLSLGCHHVLSTIPFRGLSLFVAMRMLFGCRFSSPIFFLSFVLFLSAISHCFFRIHSLTSCKLVSVSLTCVRQRGTPPFFLSLHLGFSCL